MSPRWSSAPAFVVGKDGAWRAARRLAEEVPVALSYDGTTQAVMLASPSDLEEFALGFSLGEGIVADPSEIAEIERVDHESGIEMRMWLAPGRGVRLIERRRNMAGPVGCGLCGIDSLEAATRALPRVPQGALRLDPDMLASAFRELAEAQLLHEATHAAHAAGFWTPGEGLVVAREDVGRHNALDKLVGALARRGRGAAGGAIVMTSRISIELVEKAAMAGAPLLAAISAPTARAVEAAEAAGVTLVARARGGTFELYTHPERIALTEATHET